MDLVAFVTIIFAFVASPQIGATCTKQLGTKVFSNGYVDSCSYDFYERMPIQSNNMHLNLEMASYEMSNRLQFAQNQLDGFMSYKNFEFLSGAYALNPEQELICNEKPIYIYVPIEKASLKNAIDWDEGVVVSDAINTDDDDHCLTTSRRPPKNSPKEDNFVTESDILSTTSTTTETTREPTTKSTTTSTTTESATKPTTKRTTTRRTTQSTRTTESPTTTEPTTTPESPTDTESPTSREEDLSLCDEKSEEKTTTNPLTTDRLDEHSSETTNRVRKPSKSTTTKPTTKPEEKTTNEPTTNKWDDHGYGDDDGNDEVVKKPTTNSGENISVDESGRDKDNKKKKTNPNSADSDVHSNEKSRSNGDDNDSAEKRTILQDNKGHLFVVVESPEVIDWNNEVVRKFKIDKNGNLIDILNNDKIDIRFEDFNDEHDPKRKRGIRRDTHGNLISIVPDGSLDKVDLNLVDDYRNKIIFKVDKHNNLVDIQKLEDYLNESVDSDYSVTPKPPSKIYIDIKANRFEILLLDIFFLPDYSWSSEDVVMEKPRCKYRADWNGNLIDIATGEEAGIHWEFVDENVLKPILDKRGNVIIVVLNAEIFDDNDEIRKLSNSRRTLRLDKNSILIGYYRPINISVNESPTQKPSKKPSKKPGNKSTRKPHRKHTKKTTRKPKKPSTPRPLPEESDYGSYNELPNLSKEKRVTEATYPEMFMDTDCPNVNAKPGSTDHDVSDYSDDSCDYGESHEEHEKDEKKNIPPEMFDDTVCLSTN